MIEPSKTNSNVFDRSQKYNLLSLLSVSGQRLLARAIAMLFFNGGWGEIRITFRGGDLVEVHTSYKELTKNEPEE